MEVGKNVFLKGVIDDIKEKNGKFTATIIIEGKKSRLMMQQRFYLVQMI